MRRRIVKIVNLLRPKRHWVQFRLRTLFVLVAVIAVPCAWLAWKMEHKRKERAVVTAIGRFHVWVERDWEREEKSKGNFHKRPPPPGPAWFRWLFGDDFFAEIVHVGFPPDVESYRRKCPGRELEKWDCCTAGEAVDDEGLRVIAKFTHLDSLQLGWTEVGDAGLAHLVGTRLRTLALDDTNVSDAGLVHLAKLESLERLCLSHNHGVTGTGLMQLKQLTRLRVLLVDHCPNVTDAGLVHLVKLESLEHLDLSFNDGVTDTGLANLKQLAKLQYLRLDHCPNVTDAGLVHLAKLESLEHLDLSFNDGVTDTGMMQLKRLTKLHELAFARCPNVTDAGVNELQNALPNCKIWR